VLERHLVIFARRPQLGVGKRRLARTIGNVEALRFTRSSLMACCAGWAPTGAGRYGSRRLRTGQPTGSAVSGTLRKGRAASASG
jgi:hypothetical protein